MAAPMSDSLLCDAHGVYLMDCPPCVARITAEVEAERQAFLEASSSPAPLWALEGEPIDHLAVQRYVPITGRQVLHAALFVAAVVLLMVLMAGCGLDPIRPPIPRGTGPSTTSAWPAGPPTLAAAATGLGAVAVSDTPSPGEPYRRDLWPHWKDPDGNGCDAREDALVAASTVPAVTGSGCKVTAGSWTSAYDGLVITDPSAVDVDHVVPLAEAHRSGGSTWSTDQRAGLANDQANLWPVSATSNRAKGDKDPAQWRPPVPTIWCTYAHRWLAVKAAYNLTMDTSERDALGDMLSTC
jgi:hypothetical protein